MRKLIPLAVLLLLAAPAGAQTKAIQDSVDARLATLKYVATLHDPASGGFKPDANGKPSLRATGAAARAWKYLGGESLGSKFPDKAKAAAFVMSCYDPKTGSFADAPGGKADVFTTSVGVMAAVEFGVPKEKFAKAMEYLKENAKTFEDVRIGAAAVEAWGVKECPFDLKPWFEVVGVYVNTGVADPAADGGARDTGSVVAMRLRLGDPVSNGEWVRKRLDAGQRDDGAWGKKGATGSDLESTYRVMRAYHLLKAKPKDAEKLRGFIAKCRNADGGYGVTPGKPSGVGPVYYAAIITHWLKEMEAK